MSAHEMFEDTLSPLHWAVRFGSHEVVGMLLQAKANPNHRAGNARPLDILLAQHPNSTLVPLLESMTTNQDPATEQDVQAVLVFCNQAAHPPAPAPEVIQAILESKADPNTLSNQSLFARAFRGEPVMDAVPANAVAGAQVGHLPDIPEVDEEDLEAQEIPPDDEPLSKSVHTTQSTQPASSQESSGGSQSPISLPSPP